MKMERLKTFHFPEVESNEKNNGFCAALTLITEGEDLLAIQELKKIYATTDDSSLKSNAANLLFELYFARSEWNQMESEGLLDEPTIEKSNRIIGKACNMSDSAEISFSDQPIRIPMIPSLTGCPTIEVLLNGVKKCFWLDTGAGMSVVSHSLAKECHIDLLEEKEMVVGNSTHLDLTTNLAFIDSIEIMNLQIRRQPALVLSDHLLEIQIPNTKEIMAIDGIIGWDVIQHLHLEIDYKQKQVLIKKPACKEPKERNLFFCGAPIVKVSANTQTPLYFGLDTGANKTHFGQPLLTKVDDLQVENRTTHAGGLGDLKEREIKSLEALSVQLSPHQNLTFQNVRMMLTDFATFFKLDGVFGSDIGKDGRLVIDYVNRVFEVVVSNDEI
ncbi:hypothetical protein FGG79_03200 [Bacillus sp. BHET2]|uniref:retropepsin-like aspartic protease n=1 Tax=Bacillus sp. BHET2 TaxID=2583818 RepID=UPI00110EFC0A|nr:retropepsin-like aspartic protease [Bacillus sp. BHET2]TMU87157.1 hypothetical protein FGG79_03200 [Bacillus sp. BHET2]